MPQNIYDQPDFFEGYSRFARSIEGLAGAPEWPTLRSMVPSLAGLRVIDLGCGFGAFARWAAEQGALRVLGIDLSEKMLDRARTLTSDVRIVYERADIETVELPEASFDFAYSSLALHYLEDFAKVCGAVRRILTSNAGFVFSVEHPIFTAPTNPAWQKDANGDSIWPLNAYLNEGRRVTNWITDGVAKQHRTVATYVNGLIANGFQIERLEEWGPNAAQIAEHPEWADEIQRPPFLLIAARARA